MKKLLFLLVAMITSLSSWADATIKVDDASLVKISSRDGEINISTGNNTVPADIYMITSTNSNYMLAQVQKGDEVLVPNPNSNSWTVFISDGDQIEIKAKYDVNFFSISFNDVDAIDKVVSSSDDKEVGIIQIEGSQEGSAGVTAGYKVVVTLNEDYKTNNATVFYATGNIGFNTEKLTYGTITVDAANAAKCTNAETREDIILYQGSNKVLAGDYAIMSNDVNNYRLKKVVKGNEVITAPYDYYMVTIAEGENVDITSKWLNEDGEQLKSTIVFDDANAIKSITSAGKTLKIELVEEDYIAIAPQGTKVIVTLNDGYYSTSTLNFYAEEDAYEITTEAIPVLQSTNPQNKAYVEKCPKQLMFMFNKEISKSDIENVNIAVSGQGNMDVDKDSIDVIDGYTLVVHCDELKDLPSGKVVTCTVKFNNITKPYTQVFTVQDPLAVADYDIVEGYITFNQKIGFPDKGESATAAIKKGQETVGNATLTCDDNDPTFCKLLVALPNNLQAGNYILDLAASTVMSTITKEVNLDKELKFSVAALNDYGLATFSAGKNLNITSEGVTAYKAAVEDETITLTALEGYIPAGTGVILSGEPGTVIKYATPAEEDNAADVEDNELKATTQADGTLAEKERNSWALNGNEFLQYTASQYIANKAYLVHGGYNAKSLNIVFDDVVTGISNVNADVKDGKYIENSHIVIMKNGVKYNVMGIKY